MSGVAVLPAGETAVLVDGLDPADVLPLYLALRRADVPGVVDLVPAERTLLVTFDGRVTSRERVVAAIESARDTRVLDASATTRQTVEIGVRYDGPDLEAAAGLLRLRPDEVVSRHLDSEWTVAFIGFAPGFAYLVAEGDPLAVPRRATPRPAVPTGSVALGGRYCGVYPRPTPGGWQLIGSTDAPLWDLARADPALLTPGARVVFRRV